MKATVEIPDELYRQVKAKSALEGRAVREVTEELYRGYVSGPTQLGQANDTTTAEVVSLPAGVETLPSWFGVLRHRARRVSRHDLSSIRASVAAGI